MTARNDTGRRPRYRWAILLILALSASASAQSRDVGFQGKAGSAPAGGGLYANSWALVIGIDKYQRVPGLSYAVTDASG